MSINELLSSVGDKEMDRKDFLKFAVFVMAGMVGVKNLLSLMGGMEMHPDLSIKKKVDGSETGSGYSKGRYNR